MSSGAPPFEAAIGGDPHGSVVTISGELDVANAPNARSVLDDAVNLGVGDLHVDLADVSFVDSSGLGMLIGFHKRLQATGHRLVLRQPQSRVRMALEVTGLVPRVFVVDPPTAEG